MNVIHRKRETNEVSPTIASAFDWRHFPEQSTAKMNPRRTCGLSELRREQTVLSLVSWYFQRRMSTRENMAKLSSRNRHEVCRDFTEYRLTMGFMKPHQAW